MQPVHTIIFGEIELYLPETIESIYIARGLLNLLEERMVSGWVCKHCGCTENTPCPDGCSWVAPNVCSRCAAENAPEIPEPETLRNVSKDVAKQLTQDNPEPFIKTAPPAKVASLIASGEPEKQGNKTPDSHSGGATDNLDNVVMRPDTKIPKFEYDESKMQPYKSIFFQEFPDGTVVLKYGTSHYYTTKEKVLKIPYPFPKKYFSKENGWSSSIEFAFKKYRQYLAELPQPQQQLQQQAETEKEEGHMPQNQKQKQEDPDDWKYKRFGIAHTKCDYDGGKIEGTLEG